MKYSSYKTIFVPLLLLFLLFAPKTWAQENQKQVPGLLINHHFFAKEMPMQEIFSVQKGFQRLDDGEQHSVLRVLVPADFVIPKAWKKYEIAREDVVNADKFEAGARLFDEMAAATHSGDKQLTAPKIGQKLPGTFTLHDINGGTWTQDSLQGHVTVINVWYSGCGPCRKEMPEMSSWYKAQKKGSVDMVGIALDNTENIGKFLKQTPVSYPVWRYTGADSRNFMKTFGNNVGVCPLPSSKRRNAATSRRLPAKSTLKN